MAEWNFPVDVDKLFFAESLVKFVFRDIIDVCILTILENNMGELHDAFTHGVRFAMESIEVLLLDGVETIFRIMEEDDCLNEETFADYAAYLRMICFPQDFNIESFLKYSVHIAMLASKFSSSEIFKLAVEAVSLIMDYFEDYDMVCGGGLETLAKKYDPDSEDSSDDSSDCEFRILGTPTPSPSSDDGPGHFRIDSTPSPKRNDYSQDNPAE